MRRVIRLSAEDVRPLAIDVLRRQGMPHSAIVSPRLQTLVEEAGHAFDELAFPVGLVEEIASPEFATVYEGVGQNEPETPMADMYPRARALALFAATLGEELDVAIRRCFQAHDAAFGCMLDAFASTAAETVAFRVSTHYLRTLTAEAYVDSLAVVPYSPGYCGWHVSGQAALFDRLRPQEIGIELNGRCMMQPLKSVSGVLVAGARDVHVFRPTYDCCELCATQHCRQRMRALRGPR